MPVINTNVGALNAQLALTKNERLLSTSMRQLSTGSKINSAQDDAAGLAIMQNQTAQVRGLNMAVRNMNDGVNLMQTADGALVETSNMLQRMRELAVQSSNGTYSQTQRNYLQLEFTSLGSQIDAIGSQTTWNGQNLLNSATFSFQTGIAASNSISVTITSMTLSGLSLTAAAVGISSVGSASSALNSIDTALDRVNSQRASLGATINQLTYATDSASNISANVAASRSTIADTDYASASSNLSKAQIIQQAATAMLAQANAQPQSILALLK